MEKTFKTFQKVGEESETGAYFVDATGKAYPIYQKIIDMGAGPNAGADTVAHGVASMLATGHFKAYGYYTKAATAPVISDGAALVVTLTLTNVVATSTADLTTYAGRMVIEYCKSTD